MIKAIIFDCFGVLTTDGWEPFCRKYFAEDPKKLRQAKILVGSLNLGNIKYEEFISQVAKLAKISERKALSYIDDNKRNEELFKYIRNNLKPKYKIGMLSNAGQNWLNELFTRDDLALFDDIVLSSDVGYIKPDHAIYKISLDRLSVSPSESVFVDDIRRYVTAGNEVGMSSILYRNFNDMKKQLESLLKA